MKETCAYLALEGGNRVTSKRKPPPGHEVLWHRARQTPRMARLLDQVAEKFHLFPVDVFERTRRRTRLNARHVTMWVMRKTWFPRPTYPEMQETFGFDHTTIISAVEHIDREVAKHTQLGQAAMEIATAPELRESA